MKDLAYLPNNSRGRKKATGSLIRLPNGSLGTFVGYCPNESCSSKICMSYEDAKYFSNKYHKERRRPINRLLVNLLSRLETQTR